MGKAYKITEKNLVRDEDTLRGGRWEGAAGKGVRQQLSKKIRPTRIFP